MVGYGAGEIYVPYIWDYMGEEPGAVRVRVLLLRVPYTSIYIGGLYEDCTVALLYEYCRTTRSRASSKELRDMLS